MSRSRFWIAHAVVFCLSAGSVYCIVNDAEQWPFSRYAMYSYVQQRQDLELLRLFGVKAEDGEEIPLVKFDYLQPFDRLRLRLALTDILRDRRKQSLLDDALKDCLRRYEALRVAGRHGGPRLTRVRLYRLRWRLDPWARNRERPDHRDLLREVLLPLM